jgi:hypothetical protein
MNGSTICQVFLGDPERANAPIVSNEILVDGRRRDGATIIGLLQARSCARGGWYQTEVPPELDDCVEVRLRIEKGAISIEKVLGLLHPTRGTV